MKFFIEKKEKEIKIQPKNHEEHLKELKFIFLLLNLYL